MGKNYKKLIIFISAVLITGLVIVVFTIFFDEEIIVRTGTTYHIDGVEKVIALTFDDGPSPVWTPKILDELKKAGVKATFFMLGKNVEKYPEIARRVAEEGHEIGNHTYDHHVLIFSSTGHFASEIKDAEKAIKNATGQTTKYFRPPKAWLTSKEKQKIKAMGYKIILWTLNSKDWVTFDDKYIIKYILRHIKPGDIILFHDSGGAFTTEGGDRHETVRTIPILVEKLREKGYKFVTITELLNMRSDDK